MKFGLLKTILLGLCLLACSTHCYAGTVLSNDLKPYSPFRPQQITPGVTQKTSYPSTSISQNAHKMQSSITHTTVPTPGLQQNIPQVPAYSPNQINTYVYKNSNTGNLTRYPVYHTNYTNQVLYYPVTTTTTTFSSGGNTYTYSEDRLPYTGSYGFTRNRRFLRW